MNITIRTLTCAVALAALVPVYAEEEEETAEAAGTTAETAEGEANQGKHISEIDNKTFTVLPFCRRLEGHAEVRKPGAAQWEPVEEGRFYPLGSFYQTKDGESRLEIAFGREAKVVISGTASFGTRAQGLAEKTRAVILDSGTIELQLALGFPEKLFSVIAKGFTVENPAGTSRYTYRATGDGEEALVRCVTGTFAVKGRHFEIPCMRAANELRIRTSQDLLFTGLFGKSGDYMCHLDNGLAEVMDYDANQVKIEHKFLEWKISPYTAARIFRKVPELGKNLAVSVMTFNANGELVNRCSFTEGRHEVNTGDQGPATARDRALAEKKLQEAAAAAETEEAEEAKEATEE